MIEEASMPIPQDLVERCRQLVDSLRAAEVPVQWQLLDKKSSPSPVYVGVSGGADSVFLLCVMVGLGIEVVVVHYDHHTRQGASTLDAQWVQALCDQLSLHCIREQRSHSAEASEAELRAARYDFFARALGTCGKQLYLAHHANDALETFLMRSGRGAGSAGLTAPRAQRSWNGGIIVRPLLYVQSALIRAQLTLCGIPWREDRTNERPITWRNRLRLAVVPQLLTSTSRDFMAGFLRTRQLLEEERTALDAWADKVATDQPLWWQQLSLVRALPRAVLRRLLHRRYREEGKDFFPSPTVTDRVLTAVEQGRCLRLQWGNRWVVVDAKELRIVRESPAKVQVRPFSFTLGAGEQIFFPNGYVLNCEWVSRENLGGNLLDAARATSPAKEAWLACTQEALRLQVRSLRAHDRYRPLGAPGRRKLARCLIDRKVPAAERKHIPVVCCSRNHSPVWMPGLLPSEDWKLTRESEFALRLTYRRVY